MADKERVKELINYCETHNYCKGNVRAFGKFLELSTPQILYDIISGRNGISKDLAEIITAKCLEINKSWILTGEGNMLKNSELIATDSLEKAPTVTIPREVFEQINRLTEVISSQQRVIETLSDLKKTNVRMEGIA